ncbi:MAG TPA: sugar phosphate nucleotidyltransferase [bacterium]|nr:sugar phosphate nucleotidyltransferase [bacterium]
MNLGTELIGVILAAGKGSRMYPFSERLPKPLLPILNRPLLAYQLEEMARLGIKRVIIVVGYYGFEIVRQIGDGSEWGISIEYVDQEQTFGIAHALGYLESRIDRPFLLFLGDVFFRARDLSLMITPLISGEANCVLAARKEPNPERLRRNFLIILGPDGTVARVIEKPRYVETMLKGCGLYSFDLHIFDSVRRTPRTAARDEYEITDSIQLLIQDGLTVRAMDQIEFDLNLTYPEDLLILNQWELARRGLSREIGENYSGPSPERVERSVIGNNVRLPDSISIRDSVIFSEVREPGSQDLDHVILTPDRQVALDSRNLKPLRDEL